MENIGARPLALPGSLLRQRRAPDSVEHTLPRLSSVVAAWPEMDCRTARRADAVHLMAAPDVAGKLKLELRRAMVLLVTLSELRKRRQDHELRQMLAAADR